MNWYKGGIAEAIATSKSRGAIFVVYIEGKDEKSTEISRFIDDEKVSGRLGGVNFVAIKIEAGTVPHQQFTQIFKETPVPSIYFIGKQGSPLEIVTDTKDVSSLCLKLDSVVEKAGLPVSASQIVAKQSQDLINSEKLTMPANVECENGVCTIRKEDPSTSQQKQSGTDAKENEKMVELTPEEKVERAKQLVEIQRLEKQREEEEKQRLKEIERRKMGQNVQQLKRWQDEQEMKNLLEEREREKRESQMARQRVLDQIAQDKAERAARFSGASPPQPQSLTPQNAVHRPFTTNVARLQFRMPDGRIATQDFSSQDTLEAVHAHVRNHLQLPFNQYTLSTTFPRRDFGQNDRSQTLANLELVPTAVILVLPLNRGAVSTNPSGGFTGMLWSVLTPILNILGYLRNFMFGTPSNATNNPDSDINKKMDSPNEASRLQPKRKAGDTTVVRKQGNVHRLSNNSDSDEDNNTWNGNSTQQM